MRGGDCETPLADAAREWRSGGVRGIDEYTNMAGTSSTIAGAGAGVGSEDASSPCCEEGTSVAGSIADILMLLRWRVPGLMASAATMRGGCCRCCCCAASTEDDEDAADEARLVAGEPLVLPLMARCPLVDVAAVLA